MESLRIVLMGKDFELRVISLITRARELSDEVMLLDLGSTDSTIELAERVNCEVKNHDGDTFAPTLAASIIPESDSIVTLLININSRLKLRDIPLLVNRAKENWDIHMAYISEETDQSNPQEVTYKSAEISHLASTKIGLEHLAKSDLHQNPISLDEKLRVRVLHSKPQPKVRQRESLATASRFAQLFYWMLESRHPLILFGIPGIVLFAVGYKLSGDVLDTFTEWNQTSLGVGLAVIAITLLGLFAMMVGLILYIMGKQVKQIQSHYEFWPVDD